jgi:hypothetical protein
MDGDMTDSFKLTSLALIVALAMSVSIRAEGGIIINELHTDPDVKTNLVEFIELHNTGPADVDLSGWYFERGVFYMFPGGTVLPAGGYIIVAESPEHILADRTETRLRVSESLIYGPYGGKLSNGGERVVLCDADGQTIDEVQYQLGFPWPTVGDAAVNSQPGTGRSMQLVNPSFDNNLAGSWRSGNPSPGAQNSVWAANIPPHIRQVKHSPNRPRSGETVTITAKITDPDGVQMVALAYQIVAPGNYIRLGDAAYEANWATAPMHDDGVDGDVTANDGIYAVTLPADTHVHRTLVRYRILAVDNDGYNVTVPYADDPQPNFAYFVYDGVPAWRGAVQPGSTPEVTYSASLMASLPIYHLLSKKSDVESCTWLSHYEGSDYRWRGTLVYDGHVYDHIRYRARGGVWRYAMGKNMWKFDFNRGHSFQARDDYGNKYKTTWDKLNFSACIQQGSFGQRGEQGMFEALSFRLFNMAGVPASKTNYLHFRIIDEAHEDGLLNAAHTPLTSGGTQYDGDFWGLYMTIEQMDGRFLEEHDLPDGNLFKMDNSNREVNNQGPTQPTDKSDLSSFLSRSSGASDTWWRENANLDAYYGYYAIYQAIHHGDITGKNWFLYHHPETDRWWQLPWDVDLTWTTYYGSDNPSDPWSRSGLLNHASLSMENKNRLRELIDLLWNAEQTGQLIDEYAAIINDPAGGYSMVDADRAMWDYHWVVGNGAYPTYLNRTASQKAGQGRFYAEAASRGYDRTFEGMVQVMKDYIVERASHMDSRAADAAIPLRPVITSLAPEGYPANALTFQTSPFSDPQGVHTFAAMKWRLAEVAAGSRVAEEPDSYGFTLVPESAQWRYLKGQAEPSVTPGAWRTIDFDDTDWLEGQTALGFGEGFLVTYLSDMRGNYSTIYLRKSFEASGLSVLDRLVLELKYDDGVNVWINGQLVFQDNVTAAELPHDATAISAIEQTDFISHDLGRPEDVLVEGTNVIAIQVLNASLSSSSDCFIDVRLTGEQAPEGDDDVETPAPSQPQVYRGRPGKYEIDAVWESDELTVFADSITIPGSVVQAGKIYRVRCRMKDTSGRWSHWSVPVQFTAGEPLAAGILENLRITEVMYNPAGMSEADNDEYEFIELKNIGDETLDLSTVSLTTGITFDFDGGEVTMLGPGQFALVVKNRMAFLSRYGPDLAGLIAGEYVGRLANGGENVKLEDFWNGTIVEFEYGDGRGWPLSADGAGHSLIPVESAILSEPAGSLNYGGNWRASACINGSPGTDDPVPVDSLVLNEFLAGSGSSDWIELYNPMNDSIGLSDVYLSDDAGDLKKWAVAAAVIEPHAFLSFEQSGDDLGFGLSRSGEQLYLSYLPGTLEDQVIDCVSFEAQEEDVSLGRYPDGGDWWFRMAPTRGVVNELPLSDILIDEVMYHPPDANDEYVELFNPTDTTIDLAAWRLSGAAEYTFTAGQSLAPNGRLVVVGFDPVTDVTRFGVFLTTYVGDALIPGVDIVGPWQGNLANGGERMTLEKPQASDNANDTAAWVIVDEVIYSDIPPWPGSTDGQGGALQRVSNEPIHAGNDPANWQSSLPTPGTAPTR